MGFGSNVNYTTTTVLLSVPFILVSSGLLTMNWYPAKFFSGNSYCYLAGMVVTVTCILNNTTTTVLLHLIPQIFNFIYSCPQLFKFLPCPRHRMPIIHKKSDLITYSTFPLDEKISPYTMFFLSILENLRLVKIERDKDKRKPFNCNNLTLINLLLIHCGPLKEADAVKYLLVIQAISSILGILVIYPSLSIILTKVINLPILQH